MRKHTRAMSDYFTNGAGNMYVDNQNNGYDS